MATTTFPAANTSRRSLATFRDAAILLSLWLAIFFAALFTPPLLDDADATHAQAAQAILRTGDWVTLHVDGVRYLEKAPLPYWIGALSLRLFPHHPAFAIHLPLALTVLGLAVLAYVWSRRAFNDRTALYAATFVLTSTGVFLFTRIFIPDALLSLLLAFALYLFLRSLHAVTGERADRFPRLRPYLLWTSLALAVLTKGLVALIFFLVPTALYLLLTHQRKNIFKLRPFTGLLLFLGIAAPWHLLAGMRNPAGPGHPGFFWFYFVNEHVLRFLGRRIPRDYNKLPTTLYWGLHLIWLFPWSLFTPAAIAVALRARRDQLLARDLNPDGTIRSRFDRTRNTAAHPTFTHGTVLLLGLFSATVLVFFSLSTNQEYYTFPAYHPLLMLLAAALAIIATPPPSAALHPLLTISFALFLILGLTAAGALAYGLITSRHLPFVPDIGSVLAHRSVGNYTLSLSHFFDLTGPSFAALRLPATLAAFALTLGPIIAWALHMRRRTHAALLTVAVTSATFLIAAHIALVRFAPMLSSANLAATIQTLEDTHRIAPDTQVLLYGDQAFGSSLLFYLNHPVPLIDGRSTSMLFGSTFPDAAPLFLTPQQLAAEWATGPRKLLFVPPDQRATVDALLPQHILLTESSGKALYTDRPLAIGKLEAGR